MAEIVTLSHTQERKFVGSTIKDCARLVTNVISVTIAEFVVNMDMVLIFAKKANPGIEVMMTEMTKTKGGSMRGIKRTEITYKEMGTLAVYSHKSKRENQLLVNHLINNDVYIQVENWLNRIWTFIK